MLDRIHRSAILVPTARMRRTSLTLAVHPEKARDTSRRRIFVAARLRNSSTSPSCRLERLPTIAARLHAAQARAVRLLARLSDIFDSARLARRESRTLAIHEWNGDATRKCMIRPIARFAATRRRRLSTATSRQRPNTETVHRRPNVFLAISAARWRCLALFSSASRTCAP